MALVAASPRFNIHWRRLQTLSAWDGGGMGDLYGAMVKGLGYVVLAALAGAAPAAWSQVAIEELSAEHRTLGDHTEFRFPLVRGDTETARRINTWLQVSLLERFPGGPGETPFDAVWPQEGEWTGVTYLDYQVVTNAMGFLSIVFNGEYTGAYPSAFSQSYQFETRTGQPLFLATLFTEDGVKELQGRVDAMQVHDIDAFLQVAQPNGLDQEEAKIQADLYRECRENVRTGLYDEREWQLRADALVMTRGCGFPHAVRALDDLGIEESRFDYDTLAPWLSEYGRCLLVEKRADCPPPQPGYQGVFMGEMDGRFPVTLVLGAWSGPAWYAYDKYKVPIRLHREASRDGALVLTRRDEGETTETFTLRWTDDGDLVGRWQRPGRPPLPVHLH